MGVYYVHNLKEGLRPGNWLQYWRNATGIWTEQQCYTIGCSEKATDGGHVQLDDPNNDKWYIVPLCHKCNCQHGKHFWVTGPLVPVNGGDILW